MSKREEHGLSDLPEYDIWLAMRQRCLNPKNKDFGHYGGRGITICKRWNRFTVFLSDIGRRPSSSHTIERVRNHLGYSPRNCRWIPQQEQKNNTRRNHRIRFRRRVMNLTQWARELGIKRSTLSARIVTRGLSMREAIRGN